VNALSRGELGFTIPLHLALLFPYCPSPFFLSPLSFSLFLLLCHQEPDIREERKAQYQKELGLIGRGGCVSPLKSGLPHGKSSNPSILYGIIELNWVVE